MTFKSIIDGLASVLSPPQATEDTGLIGDNNTNILDSVMGSILGKDEDGNTKSFDLSKYVTMPDFIVKADKQQGFIVVALIALIGFLLLRKRR